MPVAGIVDVPPEIPSESKRFEKHGSREGLPWPAAPYLFRIPWVQSRRHRGLQWLQCQLSSD